MSHEQVNLGHDLCRPKFLASNCLFSASKYPLIDFMLITFVNNNILILTQSNTTLLFSLFIFVAVEQPVTNPRDYSSQEQGIIHAYLTILDEGASIF